MSKEKAANASLAFKAEKALKEAVLGVIKDHEKTGHPVIIWRGSRVVRANPSKLLCQKANRT